MSTEKLLDLSIDIEQIFKSVSLKKSVLSLALSIGIAGTVTPFLFKGLDRESKTMLLLAGLIGNVVSSVLPRDTKDEKLQKVYEKTVTDNYTNQLKHEVYRSNAKLEIRERNLLADYVDNDVLVPSFQKAFWGTKFGVIQLMSSLYIDNEAQNEPSTEQQNNLPLQVTLSKTTFDNELEKISEVNKVDLTWINQISPQSKIIVGGRGSGKSHFMRYLVAHYIINYPNDEWFIIDPHYSGYEDEFDYNNPESAWFLGVNPNTLKSKIIDNTDNGYALLMNIYSVLQERIKKKIKIPKISRIMVFIDEFEAFKKGLSDDEFKNLLTFIEVVQDEGRKFGVELTIGCHSLKKERTGIDSTVIGQMNWLLMENAATDGSTKFPADFDQKQITKKLKAVNLKKDYKTQRSFVLTTPRGEVIVDLLPRLSLPTFSFKNNTPVESAPTAPVTTDSPIPTDKFTHEQKAYIALKEWASKRTSKPDAKEIADAWFKLTGKKLDDNGLKYLMEKLGL